MDAIKKKMDALRLEANDAAENNAKLSERVKELEQENLTKEHEITSLKHRNQTLEDAMDKHETNIKDLKSAVDQGSHQGTQAESLQRKVAVLEAENENTDKLLRETNEKLRQTDVKAGHYERKVVALEQQIEADAKKYEELLEKYNKQKAELEDFSAQLATL